MLSFAPPGWRRSTFKFVAPISRRWPSGDVAGPPWRRWNRSVALATVTAQCQVWATGGRAPGPSTASSPLGTTWVAAPMAAWTEPLKAKRVSRTCLEGTVTFKCPRNPSTTVLTASVPPFPAMVSKNVMAT